MTKLCCLIKDYNYVKKNNFKVVIISLYIYLIVLDILLKFLYTNIGTNLKNTTLRINHVEIQHNYIAESLRYNVL